MKSWRPGQGLAGPQRGMDLVEGLGTARLQIPALQAECSDGVRGRSVLRQASKGALSSCVLDPVRGGVPGDRQLWEGGRLPLHHCLRGSGGQEHGAGWGRIAPPGFWTALRAKLNLHLWHDSGLNPSKKPEACLLAPSPSHSPLASPAPDTSSYQGGNNIREPLLPPKDLWSWHR